MLVSPYKAFKNYKTDKFESVCLQVAIDYGKRTNSEIAKSLGIKDVKQISKIASQVRKMKIAIASKSLPESKKKLSQSKGEKEIVMSVLLTAMKNKEKNENFAQAALLRRNGETISIVALMFENLEEKIEAFKNISEIADKDSVDEIVMVNDTNFTTINQKDGSEEKSEALVVTLIKKDSGYQSMGYAKYKTVNDGKKEHCIFEAPKFVGSGMKNEGRIADIFNT